MKTAFVQLCEVYVLNFYIFNYNCDKWLRCEKVDKVIFFPMKDVLKYYKTFVYPRLNNTFPTNYFKHNTGLLKTGNSVWFYL